MRFNDHRKGWLAVGALVAIVLAVVFIAASNFGGEQTKVRDRSKTNARETQSNAKAITANRALLRRVQRNTRNIVKLGRRLDTLPSKPGIQLRPGVAGALGGRGPRGVPGPFGASGAGGPIGATGPKGDKGDKGDKGEDGAPGQDGADGAPGPPGPEPVSFTFVVGAITYTCTDPEQDGSYACASSP